MFTPKKIYDQRAIATVTSRSTRCIRRWRERGLIPPPDVLLGGRDPAWMGSTLNDAPAFARPPAADAA
ncbi:MAG: hypothetical protein E4H01_08510 [Lysobacterales bacterium]|nr:MAG: hypothetical protein E4H01_08510 [Xanthomonadales bacterium]